MAVVTGFFPDLAPLITGESLREHYKARRGSFSTPLRRGSRPLIKTVDLSRLGEGCGEVMTFNKKVMDSRSFAKLAAHVPKFDW